MPASISMRNVALITGPFRVGDILGRFAVTTFDRFGNRVPALLQVAISEGGGSITAPLTFATDWTAEVQTGTWVAGRVPGTNTLTLSVVGNPAVFNLVTREVIAGTPAALVKVAGDNQTVPAGTAVPIPPSVRVEDRYGNPLNGIEVTFTLGNGGTAVIEKVRSGADGVATVSGWTLGSQPGSYVANVVATLGGAGFATFTATVPPP
jgi:hypothetical protein